MSSSPSNSPSGIETDLIYSSTRLTVQTFFFGVYSVLAVLSVRMLLKRGLKTRANHVIFICTIFTYLLSATYWTYSVCDFMDRMRIYIHYLRDPLDFSSTFSLDSDHDAVGKWSPLFNAMMLVNYIFSDAIVVWRAWIISWRGYRKYLCVTGLFLVLTAVTITCTIIFRIIALVESPYASLPHSNYLTWGVDILQIANIGFSLISNLSATAVVGATAWRHRRSIRAAFADNKKNTKADQILSLVVESGAGYCVSGLTVLIASLIRLPQGTLGDIYTPINVQIAGAYPSVVLLLISMQRSLNETTFLKTFEGSTPSRPIEFGASAANSRNQNRIQFARNPEISRITEQGLEGEMADRDLEMRSAQDNSQNGFEQGT